VSRIEPPNPIYKAIRAFYGTIVPLGVPFRGADEKGVNSDRIGPVCLDERIRADRIALRFGHLRAVAAYHALGKQTLEGLVESNVAFVLQELDDEPRVEQVQYGVLDAAYVLVDGEPRIDRIFIEWLIRFVRR
jgi:hypothetical protein